MKLFILVLLLGFNCLAESPAKNSAIIDMLSVKIAGASSNEKTLSILVGFEKKKMILDSIASLCEKKNLECQLSDDEAMPLSRIVLTAKGKADDLKNLEKQID